MDNKVLKLIKKIQNNNDTFVVFTLSHCGYCKNTIKLLKNKNLKYKNYEIDKYYDIFIKLLKNVGKIHPEFKINLLHETFPVIFYNSKFIGGYDNLIKSI